MVGRIQGRNYNVNWRGGGGIFIYSCFASQISFQLDQSEFDLTRNWLARTWIYKYTLPPINVLVTALGSIHQTTLSLASVQLWVPYLQVNRSSRIYTTVKKHINSQCIPPYTFSNTFLSLMQISILFTCTDSMKERASDVPGGNWIHEYQSSTKCC